MGGPAGKCYNVSSHVLTPHSSPLRTAVFSAEFLSIVLLSLRVSGTAVLFSSALGIPLGTWLGLARHPAASLVRWCTQVGMALPPVVVGLALYLLFSRSGPLGDWGWLFTPRAMIVAQTILALPFVVGITAGAIRSVPDQLPEQLRGLGASARQARRTVVFEARHGLGLAVAAAFGRSLSEVGAVLIVGGNIAGHTRVLTTAIVLETSQGRFEWALALGGVLLGLAGLANACIVLFQRGQPGGS